MRFQGIPDYRYALDWTHSLVAPIFWLPLQTNVANDLGAILFTNTPSGGSDFYRTRCVP